MIKYFFRTIVVGLIIASTTFAQALPPINNENIQTGEANYQLVHHGKISGHMFYDAKKSSENYVIEDTTTLVPNIRETMTVVADATTFELRSISMNADFNRQIRDADLVYEQGRLTGIYGVKNSNDFLKREVVFDQKIPADTIPRGVIFAIISGMPMTIGQVHEFKWFNTHTRSVEDIKITIAGEETVIVPAGTFEVFRADIDASTQNVAYITVAEPRKVVRIDVPKQDMRFELLPTIVNK